MSQRTDQKPSGFPCPACGTRLDTQRTTNQPDVFKRRRLLVCAKCGRAWSSTETLDDLEDYLRISRPARAG